MKKTFFIADTHFGDSAIIDYENRPFSDVREMDDTIIRNRNSVVSDGDRVFVIGDFSAYGREISADIYRLLKAELLRVLRKDRVYSRGVRGDKAENGGKMKIVRYFLLS